MRSTENKRTNKLPANTPVTPLIEANIHISSNVTKQLVIFQESQIDFKIKEFVNAHHLKQKVIPFIRSLIDEKISAKKSQSRMAAKENIERSPINARNVILTTEGKKSVEAEQSRVSFSPRRIAFKIRGSSGKKSSRAQIDGSQGCSSPFRRPLESCQDSNRQNLFSPDFESRRSENNPSESFVFGFQEFEPQLQMVKIPKLLKRQPMSADSKARDQKVLALFQRLTMHNPEGVFRVHPDYINFTKFTQDQLNTLHEIFIKISEQEIEHLDLPTLEKIVRRYDLLDKFFE